MASSLKIIIKKKKEKKRNSNESILACMTVTDPCFYI